MGAVPTEGKVYPLVRQESLNGLRTVEFLKHLLRCAGALLLVIWFPVRLAVSGRGREVSCLTAR